MCRHIKSSKLKRGNGSMKALMTGVSSHMGFSVMLDDQFDLPTPRHRQTQTKRPRIQESHDGSWEVESQFTNSSSTQCRVICHETLMLLQWIDLKIGSSYQQKLQETSVDLSPPAALPVTVLTVVECYRITMHKGNRSAKFTLTIHCELHSQLRLIIS